MADNDYTLITGASEGLGKYLALECARRRRNLVLIALPGSGLHQLAAYIHNRYRVQVVDIEKDLSTEKNCFELYACVQQQSLRVNCLINNAGIGGSHRFEEKDVLFYSRQIAINITAPTLLTRLFLADLRRHAPAHVLFVSSLAGYLSLPSKQVYGATKSYLLRFSNNLRTELKAQGISVSVVCPGAMGTRWDLLLEQRLHSSWIFRQSVFTPAKVASLAIDGMLKDKAVVVPGFWNKVFLGCNQVLPGKLKERLTRYQIKKDKSFFTPEQNPSKKKELITIH